MNLPYLICTRISPCSICIGGIGRTVRVTVRRAKCSCPIWVQGVLRGESVRKSLDLTNWEAANRLVRDWEVSGTTPAVTVKEATERFISDRQSMKLSDAMMSKYRNVAAELEREFGNSPLRSVTTDGLRRLRESWTLAPITMQKRLEMVGSSSPSAWTRIGLRRIRRGALKRRP